MTYATSFQVKLFIKYKSRTFCFPIYKKKNRLINCKNYQVPVHFGYNETTIYIPKVMDSILNLRDDQNSVKYIWIFCTECLLHIVMFFVRSYQEKRIKILKFV